jgi:PPM family protein phosphatase
VGEPQLSARGRSDVGRVRAGNEDALHVGTTVFAVADGMGGHRAGEVASAAALGPLVRLDGERFATPDAALSALVAAVAAANTEVVRLAGGDPELAGMGTTLTALLLEGGRAHLAHVGDSRAYLLRGDELVQLTADHTLVQALLDEGRISPEQVGTHPHRSVITRAIGVADDVEVDGRTLMVTPGDRLLVCSDGLTGVVDDATIARLLAAGTPQDAVDALAEAADDGGAPDNVTVLVVAVAPDAPRAVGAAGAAGAAGPAGPASAGTPATAVLPRTVVIRTDDLATEPADWARRYSDLGAQAGPRARRPGGRSDGTRDGAGDRGGRAATSRGAAGRSGGRGRARARTLDRLALRLLVGLLALGLVGGMLGLGVRLILDRAYLVGVEGEEVVIYRGFNVQVGPVDLRRVHERPGVLLAEVPDYLQPLYLAGRPAADLRDARRMVDAIPRVPVAAAPTGDAGPTGSSGGTPP